MEIKPVLMVLDDESAIGELITEVAELMGYVGKAYTRVTDFKAGLTRDTSVVFLDLMMPDEDGIEVIRYLAQQKINAQIILMSGFDKRVLKSAAILAKALGLKIAAELTKPMALNSLREAIASCAVPSQGMREQSPEFSPQQLTSALADGRLFVQYQPKIDLNTKQVFGAEALVRIRGEDGRIVPPVQFIQLAEQSGEIIEITRQVIKQSILFCAQLKDMGHEINIAVNMPAQFFTDVHFTDELINEVHAGGILPGNITIEITESALVENYAISLDVLTRLRMKGVHLSIDDFGTGYSTMQQLKNVPFTELKLDRSFVVDIFDDDARTIITKSIELSHELGLKVLAEGVENQAIADLLTTFGCDYCQGYHFSRPVDPQDFIDYLGTHSHADHHSPSSMK